MRERMASNGLGQRITYRDLLVFGEKGPIDNRLRFADECVRHKILDMVGDLSLLEADIHGRVSAYRSGHHLNAELVRQLRRLRFADATQEVRLMGDSSWPPKSHHRRMSTRGLNSVTMSSSAPIASIGPHARIGDGTELENQVTIKGHTTIGCGNHFHPGLRDRR